MKKHSIKLEGEIYHKAEGKMSKMKPAGYDRRMLKKQLGKESKLTRVHSLEIVKEFEMPL